MSENTRPLQMLKRLIWLYFWLLIFEGALRKWVVPQLSAPLLIARDPVVLLTYALALSQGVFPRNGFIRWTLVLAVLSFFASLGGIGTLKATLFGLHADFLHLPLIFLIPKVFDEDDVKKIGKWLLILSVPMTLLVLMQFRASPDARVNAAAGGEIGGQMYAAAGKIRPPGTFSFVTGMVSFISLVAAYLSWHFLDTKIYSRILAFAAVPALVLSVAISGSRSAVVAVALVAVMVAFICLRRGVASLAHLKYVVVIGLVCGGMSFLPVFREGVMVQQERFEAGGGVHEGIIDRFFGELISSLDGFLNAPLMGLGLGLGTNAAAGLVSGERQFLLSEGEWGRVILESGPILGGGILILRFAILGHLWIAAMRSLRRGSSLPLLLLSAMGLDLITGQFGQPTELGFVVFTCGLCLVPPRENPELPAMNAGTDDIRHGTVKKVRGRSAYAEILHGGKTKG